MKVCFIYTPGQMMNKRLYTEKIWQSYSKNAIILPHLGMSYLAALLRKKGVQAHLIDANALNLTKDQILQQLNEIRPDYLLYTAITDNFQNTLYWIKNIKQGYHRPVIIGGPHMEIYPLETLNHDSIDYGVIGDGWETLPELLAVLENKKDLSAVKGICFRKNNEIVITETRTKSVSLEDVPFPARDMLPNDRYDTVLSKARPITTMVTALGCPFNCTYCCVDTNVRARAAEHVVAEVQECVRKYGIREIEFYDETFTVNKEKIFRFLELIEKNSLKFLWSIRTRPNCVNKEMIDRMSKAGCIRINYGIESGDEKILESLGRDIPLDTIRNVTKWSKQANIAVFGFFMIGVPGDTKESIEKTLSLMLELDLDFIQLNKFMPVPNSKIYEDIKKNTGYDFWRDYTLGKKTIDDFKPTYLDISQYELDGYLENGYKRFYYRAGYIWQKLLAVKSFRELRRMASAALSLSGNKK